MCQAIPHKVLEVADGRAEVLACSRAAWVSTIALPDLTPGEYVLVYAGVALERVPEEEALELLRFLEELDGLFGEEQPLALGEQQG